MAEPMNILAFVALIVGVLLVMFRPRRSGKTFTNDEWSAFEKAEQVKKDLGKVQTMIGPAKAPYTLTIGGANIPPPPPPPSLEKKDAS